MDTSRTENLTGTESGRAQKLNMVRDAALQSQLLERRKRLSTATADSKGSTSLVQLLHEVDAALERMNSGTFGVCETCHDTIENERLLVDPLIRNCLDHLSAIEQRGLQRDLDLAYEIQNGLLPRPDIRVDGWQVAYHYEPAGHVSGDYCDLIIPERDSDTFFFLIGDVTGKGVAASLLMAHLHAIFRSLITANLPVDGLVSRANRIFCEGTMSTHFATLVCGRASRNGLVELCNAGHCFPLAVRGTGVQSIPSTGLPLGLFCDSEFSSRSITLEPGESLALYTDGVTELRNPASEEYGEPRLSAFLGNQRTLEPRNMIAASIGDLSVFRAGAAKTDDVTMMVIRRD